MEVDTAKIDSPISLSESRAARVWKLWLIFLLSLTGIAVMVYPMITQYGDYNANAERNIVGWKTEMRRVYI